MRTHFLAPRHLLPAVTSRGGGLQGAGEGRSGASFNKDISFITVGSAVKTQLLPKGPPPSTIALGVRVQHMDLGNTVQSMALREVTGISGGGDVPPGLYTPVTINHPGRLSSHLLNSIGFQKQVKLAMGFNQRC